MNYVIAISDIQKAHVPFGSAGISKEKCVPFGMLTLFHDLHAYIPFVGTQSHQFSLTFQYLLYLDKRGNDSNDKKIDLTTIGPCALEYAKAQQKQDIQLEAGGM